MGEQSYITRFRAQEEGFRQLTTELRQMGAIGDQAFERIERSSREANTGLARIDATSRTLQTGFSGLTRGAVALTGALAAIGGVSLGISEIVGQLGEFEIAFKNVRVVVDENVVSTARMSERLRELPALLGSSTQLAAGLYETLQAGVPAADAVRFVGDAAAFSKAAILETNEAVTVATTIINAYGLEANKSKEVFDKLFQTVLLGRTSGQDVARFLGPAITAGQALKISFDEVLAAYAALTLVLTPTQAADALRSLFASLSINAAKLRAESIDLQDVIGAGGLTGTMEALARVTGLNSEALQKLLGDQNAITGAQLLAGTQAASYADILRDLGGSDGSVTRAVEKQTQGMTGAWDELVNTWDRVIQQGTFVNDTLETISRAATSLLEPFTTTGIERLEQELTVLQEKLKRTQESVFSVDPLGFGGGLVGNFFSRIFGQSSDEIVAEIERVQKEIEKLRTEGTAPLGPSRDELERGRRLQVEQEQRAKAASEAQAKIEAAEAKRREDENKRREAAALATQQRLEAIEQRHADETIRIFEQRNAELERLNLERIRDADHATRTIRKFRRDLADEELLEQERLQDQHQRIRERARDQQERDEDRADEAALRAAERQREELLRPFVELGNDISENLSDAIVGGLTSGDIDEAFKFLERSFADFTARLIQAQVSDPLFEQLTEGIQGSLTTPAGQPVSAAPVGAGVGSQIAAGSTADPRRGALSGTAGTTLIILGGTAAAAGIARAAGAPDVATDIIGGVGSGAATGALVGSAIPGIGTAVGAVVGGVVGGVVAAIPHLFGGEGATRGQLRTGLLAPTQAEASDRFVAESPFGFLSFTNEGTKRFDAAAAAKFVVQLDEAVAELITDRQEAVVTAVLGTRNLSPQFEGGSQEDVVAQIVFDRLASVIDALAGRNLSKDLFAGYAPSAANIENIAETANQLIEVLGAVDEFRSPSAPLNEAATAIRDLDERFDSLADTARRFGLAEEERIIRLQQASERAQLTTDFNEQIRRESLGFTDPGALELELLEERRQDALANARTLGADINAVEQRFALERLAIVERFAQDAVSAEEINRQNQNEILRRTDPRGFALQQVEEQRQEALRIARESGANINLVERRFALERLEILERFAQEAVPRISRLEFNRNQRVELFGLNDPTGLQLLQVQERRAEALRIAREVGGSINLVERRFARERRQIIEQENERLSTVVRRDFSAIGDFIESFQTSEQSGLTITQRLTNANRFFTQALRGDDTNQVVHLAGEILDLERQRVGSTPAFFERQEEIFRALEDFRRRESRQDDRAIAREQRDIQKQQLERQRRIHELMAEQNVLLAQQANSQQQVANGFRVLQEQQQVLRDIVGRFTALQSGV